MMLSTRGAASAALIFSLILFVLEAYATVISFQESGVAGLRFYTVLSNEMMLIASAFTLFAFRFPGIKDHAELLNYIATCMLMLTFLVVIFVLTPLDLKDGVNPAHYYIGCTATIHHVVAPILAFINFCFVARNESLASWVIAAAMGVTLVYTIVILYLNYWRVMVGPYPFFHIYEQSLQASIFWIIAIGAFALLIDVVVFHLGKS